MNYHCEPQGLEAAHLLFSLCFINFVVKQIFKTMKKLLSTLLLAAAMLLANNGAQAQKFIIEPDGVGPVRHGVYVNTLPAVVEGLYDSRQMLEEYNEMDDEFNYLCYFMLNGDARIIANLNEDGMVCYVLTSGSDIRSKSGAYDPMPARDFIVLPGITTKVNPDMDYFQIRFEIDGLDVLIDYYSFSAQGQKKYDAALRSGVAPKFVPEDFAPEAFIMINREY